MISNPTKHNFCINGVLTEAVEWLKRAEERRMTLSVILAEVSGEHLSHMLDTKSDESVVLISSEMSERNSSFCRRIDSNSFDPRRYWCKCRNRWPRWWMVDFSFFWGSSDGIDAWISSVGWWLTRRERGRQRSWVSQWRIITCYLTVHLDKEWR